MPVKKKKKFIDKKNAVTFHLVHRSQRDPLQADEDAPQRVLLHATEAEKVEARREEQNKFGITFDDDYDYMQHLRDVNELSQVEPLESFRIEKTPSKKEREPQIILPSEVFASELETDVGLLNKAVPIRGPQPDWDPDIVAGLDEDFDFENPDNQLDDDFVMQAMAEGGAFDDADEEGAEEDDVASDEADLSSDFGSYDGDDMFMQEETKSRFTSYSMTSSVMRRNEGLTLLDDRFEKIYEQYDDEEIGALDHEDIGGCMDANSELLNHALAEFEENQKQVKLKDAVQPGEGMEESDSESEGELVEMRVEEPKEKWDCESILSTYSNLYNHPKLIEEPKKIKLTKRLQIPAEVLAERGPTRKQLEDEETNRLNSLDKVPTYRPKGESTDERKERKKAIKEERKARREEKKANKEAFKSEKKRQVKEMLNVQQALKGVQIQ